MYRANVGTVLTWRQPSCNGLVCILQRVALQAAELHGVFGLAIVLREVGKEVVALVFKHEKSVEFISCLKSRVTTPYIV